MKSIPLVHLSTLRPVVSGLRAAGLDPELVLAEVGLTVDAVAHSDSRVHVMVVHEFLEHCARLARDRTFCASIGAQMDPTGWPMLEQGMRHARSLGDFLSIYVNGSNTVASSVVAYMNTRADLTKFGESRVFEPSIAPAQNDGFMCALKISMLERWMGDRMDPRQVVMVLCDPAALPPRYSQYQVLRGNWLGSYVQFPSDWLASTRQDGAVARLGPVKPPTFTDTGFLPAFRTLLRQHIDRGGLDAEAAAKLVHLTPRQLARQLAAFGTSPSAELKAAKIDRAKAALRSGDGSVGDIASALGYRDPSNFTRAFRKETGQSPASFRKQVLETTRA